MEAKPFASLSSGLLARKGAARPAMRPQGFGQLGGGLEDLGWNDMGFEPPKPARPDVSLGDHDPSDVAEHPRGHALGLTPVQSPVHDQQAELAERLNGFADTEIEETDDTAEPWPCEPEDTSEGTADAAPPEAPPVSVQLPVSAPVSAPVATPIAAPRRLRRPRAAPGTKAKAAFTLRLDPDRHLKLRLACAVDGRSAQQLVTDALDQLLERMPEVDGLAAKAKRRG